MISLIEAHNYCADFGKLARAMSVKNCQHSAFHQLRDQLRVWFPEQR